MFGTVYLACTQVCVRLLEVTRNVFVIGTPSPSPAASGGVPPPPPRPAGQFHIGSVRAPIVIASQSYWYYSGLALRILPIQYTCVSTAAGASSPSPNAGGLPPPPPPPPAAGALRELKHVN